MTSKDLGKTLLILLLDLIEASDEEFSTESNVLNETIIVTQMPLELENTCRSNCSSRGICDENSGKCVCESLFFGEECQSKFDSQ